MRSSIDANACSCQARGHDRPRLRWPVTLDILLYGCGRWGVHVLRDLRELGARVTALARSEATRDRAAAGGAARVVGSLGEAGAAPDGVVIVTPASNHAAILETAPLGHARSSARSR